MSLPDVLVSGSSGHLGYALMIGLPRYGYTPLGLDILPSDQKNTIVGSITDRALITKILKDNPSIRYVLHTATLHKPHVESHGKEAFIEINIEGTLILLEEASKTGRIEAFIFTSTTSTFGRALAPRRGQLAAWIDETVTPIPKNIYGVTKCAAEDMCQLIHTQTQMPTLILKTSRFFPEADDNAEARAAYSEENLKVNELLHRRVDISDVVSAHVQAMIHAKAIGFGKYIISAPPSFTRSEDLRRRLNQDAASVIKETIPKHADMLLNLGWKLPDRMDRVYDSTKAVRELDWRPTYTFEYAVECMARGEEYRSELTAKVGRRGYHDVPTGVYTL